MGTTNLALARHFVRRELRERYRGSFTGLGWALLQPLLQLAIYAFVFVQIFKAKVPGAAAPGYVPFLVVGMWPWVAFSDAVLKATTSIQDNSALIGKVAFRREVLVLAPCAASVLLQLAGFLVILLVLAGCGQGIRLSGIPLAMLLYVPLFAFTYGLAMVFASLQVFVRDLVQLLGQVLTLMMFAAPIFYDRASLPEQYRVWLDFNPFTAYVEIFRALLLDHGDITLKALLIVVCSAGFMLALGIAIFRRLDAHFEDFL